MRVEQAVQCLGAFRQLCEIAFLQGFGERVEQAPYVPSFKCIMSRLAPLMQHGWDVTVAAHANIRGTDDQVMGFDVSDFCFFVGGDAFVLIMPFG